MWVFYNQGEQVRDFALKPCVIFNGRVFVFKNHIYDWGINLPDPNLAHSLASCAVLKEAETATKDIRVSACSPRHVPYAKRYPLGNPYCKRSLVTESVFIVISSLRKLIAIN